MLTCGAGAPSPPPALRLEYVVVLRLIGSVIGARGSLLKIGMTMPPLSSINFLNASASRATVARKRSSSKEFVYVIWYTRNERPGLQLR